MEEGPGKSDSGRDESEDARLDRNMNELLQELRVSQTGVQIMFAFLLTLPFTQRFTKLTSFQKDVYFVTLLSAASAAALFIAPVSFHRLLFRRQEKAYLITSSNWMAIGGLGCLAIAMVGVILLITDFIFSGLAAWIATGCFALIFVVLWYVLPLIRLARHQRRHRG
jgi:hypothetical protein